MESANEGIENLGSCFLIGVGRTKCHSMATFSRVLFACSTTACVVEFITVH